MSSQRTEENRQEEYDRSVGAGTTRQSNAEELLSELKRLLESSGRPPFAPQPPSSSASIVSPSAAAEPQRSTDFDTAHDSTGDLTVDGSLERRPADPRDTFGQHQDLTGEVTHLRSRRWRLRGFWACIWLRGSRRRGTRPQGRRSRVEEPSLRCPNAGAKQCPAAQRGVRCRLERRRRPRHERQRAA